MSDQQPAQDEVGAPDEEQHHSIQRDGPRGEMRVRHPARDERHQGQPEQHMQVRPQYETVHALRGLEQVVVVVPVDADEDARLGSCGVFISSTMIVMMMAMTPSLNASSRPLLIPGLVYCREVARIGR